MNSVDNLEVNEDKEIKKFVTKSLTISEKAQKNLLSVFLYPTVILHLPKSMK